MDEIDIKDLAEENIEDLCQVCVPPNKWHHPDWIEGVAEKKKWAVDMLRKWGPFAKVACQGGTPVGMIQYEDRVLFVVLRLHTSYSHPREAYRHASISRETCDNA